MRLWDVATGKQLFIWQTLSPVRAVHFNEDNSQALFVTDASMGQTSTIHIINVAKDPTSRKFSFFWFNST